MAPVLARSHFDGELEVVEHDARLPVRVGQERRRQAQ
jgi:hypothetical protein